MKYKKGSTVEVFGYQSWRCARIVSGKGHNYTVSYDVYPGFTNKDDVEHISIKSIRPCPPLFESLESWVPGDVAEVFQDLSWKMAIVLKDFGLDQFIVRLVGSLQEFEVTKSELRVRQSYQNGEWIVIGKVPSDHKDANRPKLDGKQDFYTKDLRFDTQNNPHLLDSRIVSSKTLKRASLCSYSQDEPNKKSFVEGIEDHESDAESVCQFGYHEESQSQEPDESDANEAVADEIHRLELHAYRYTMAALHASGPLNWEKETMFC
ncbi:putative ENT domain, Agenet-like domain, Agenet domain, plant type, ENT domain-like superfamily [Helianthus annuus]|nr:putative ENT domain, Agenet-like domain, Agenet domain, plant type, ENT domain-like superfamily [Helianthus annuus]